MKTQQAAEREEQQRIKNLVLNYDLRDGEEQDGDFAHMPLLQNPNIHNRNAGLEKAAALTYSRPDKSGNNRSGQRARKLQLSDVDWYAKPTLSQVTNLSTSTPNPTLLVQPNGSVPSVVTPLSEDTSASRRIINATSGSMGRNRNRLSRKEMLESHAALNPNTKTTRKR